MVPARKKGARGFSIVIPGHRAAMNYDVQLHI
jgi:hypothetical protein